MRVIIFGDIVLFSLLYYVLLSTVIETSQKSYFLLIIEIMRVIYIFITRNLILIMVTIMYIISSKSYSCSNLPYCVVGSNMQKTHQKKPTAAAAAATAAATTTKKTKEKKKNKTKNNNKKQQQQQQQQKKREGAGGRGGGGGGGEEERQQ